MQLHQQSMCNVAHGMPPSCGVAKKLPQHHKAFEAVAN
jgi:hypothetical protein